MVVEVQLMTTLDLLLCVVQSLFDDFFALGGSLVESVLESGDARSVDEEEVAVDLVVVDLLSTLNVDIENTDLLYT